MDDFYKLDEFIKEYFGINLRVYQKIMLKLIMKDGFHSNFKTRR